MLILGLKNNLTHSFSLFVCAKKNFKRYGKELNSKWKLNIQLTSSKLRIQSAVTIKFALLFE